MHSSALVGPSSAGGGAVDAVVGLTGLTGLTVDVVEVDAGVVAIGAGTPTTTVTVDGGALDGGAVTGAAVVPGSGAALPGRLGASGRAEVSVVGRVELGGVEVGAGSGAVVAGSSGAADGCPAVVSGDPAWTAVSPDATTGPGHGSGRSMPMCEPALATADCAASGRVPVAAAVDAPTSTPPATIATRVAIFAARHRSATVRRGQVRWVTAGGAAAAAATSTIAATISSCAASSSTVAGAVISPRRWAIAGSPSRSSSTSDAAPSTVKSSSGSSGTGRDRRICPFRYNTRAVICSCSRRIARWWVTRTHVSSRPSPRRRGGR